MLLEVVIVALLLSFGLYLFFSLLGEYFFFSLLVGLFVLGV